MFTNHNTKLHEGESPYTHPLPSPGRRHHVVRSKETCTGLETAGRLALLKCQKSVEWMSLHGLSFSLQLKVPQKYRGGRPSVHLTFVFSSVPVLVLWSGGFSL